MEAVILLLPMLGTVSVPNLSVEVHNDRPLEQKSEVGMNLPNENSVVAGSQMIEKASAQEGEQYPALALPESPTRCS